MAPKARKDLVVPYKHVPSKVRTQASGMIAQTLPMAGMFLRNKMISWSSLFLAVQSYLADPYNPDAASDGSQPPLLRVLFAFISLAVCYTDLIFPSTSAAARRVAAKATEAASTAIATATS